jgi:hypothetical protein
MRFVGRGCQRKPLVEEAGVTMKQKKAMSGLVIVAMALLSLACRFSLPAPTATPINLLEPVFATSTSVAATAASAVTDTPVPSTPTPRTGPAEACPTPGNANLVPSFSDATSLAQELTAYLNSGGSADALDGLIKDKGLGPMQGPATLSLDLNNDGWLDVAVAMADPTLERAQPPGPLFVFTCTGSGYQLVFSLGASPEHNAPELLDSQDLNGDHADDLLFGLPSCGASTCFVQIQVLTWLDGQAQVRLSGQSDDLPFPDIQVEAGADGSLPRIAVTGTAVGSVGAGPYRQRTRYWAWDESAQTFAVSGELERPAQYRNHVLNDAQQASAQGDYATAEQLYRRVIHDESLKGWVDPPTEWANLSAFAQFRLVVIYLQSGQSDRANQAYGQLQSDFPQGATGHSYAEMGATLWKTLQGGSDLGTACRAASGYASANSQTILDPLYFGYANPTYEPSDMCPTP